MTYLFMNTGESTTPNRLNRLPHIQPVQHKGHPLEDVHEKEWPRRCRDRPPVNVLLPPERNVHGTRHQGKYWSAEEQDAIDDLVPVTLNVLMTLFEVL